MTNIEDLTRRVEALEAALATRANQPSERIRGASMSDLVLDRMRERGLSFPRGTRVRAQQVAQQIDLPGDRVYTQAIGSVLRSIGMRSFKSNGVRWFVMP